MRKVIAHYHVFKNAGTSIDKILESSFRDKWLSYDTPNKPGAKISTNDLKKIIRDNPTIKAFSSHQIFPPVPDMSDEGVEIFPILFLRHPLDRIMSCYLFEWGKQKGLDQPKESLTEYINFRFEKYRRNAIEEFQTFRCASLNEEMSNQVYKQPDDELLTNSKKFIDTVRFYGIVEYFNESLQKLDDYLKPHFDELTIKNIRTNSLQDKRLSIDEKIDNFKNSIDKDLFEEVLKRNRLDLELYQYAKSKFEKSLEK